MKSIITIIALALGLTLNAQIYINNAPKTSQTKIENNNGGIIINENPSSVKKEVVETKTTVIEVVEKAEEEVVVPVVKETTKVVVKEPIVEPKKEIVPVVKKTEVVIKESVEKTETMQSTTSTNSSLKSTFNEPLTYIRKKIPAQYETVYETQKVTNAPKTTTVQVKPELKEVEEQVMLTPATKKWVKTGVKEDCKSTNPKDCEVLTLIEVPATYKTVKKTVTIKESFKKEIVQPKIFKVVKKEVLLSPERYEDVLVSSTNSSYKQPEQKTTNTQTTSAKISNSVLPVSLKNLNKDKITQIQKTLTSIGYYSGPVTGVLDNQTKDAIKSFQKDNNISSTTLNTQTLNLLGIY